jgi:hypothetical protein
MGIKYIATFDAVATTVQTDLFEINAPSDRSIIVHEIGVSQSSDFGDAQAEILKLQLLKGYSTSGSGGSAPTPAALQGSATASTAIEANNTTVATTGTPKVLLQDSFNVALPYIKLWTPETRPELKASERLVLRLPAPADSLTLNGYVIFEEIGG